MVQEYHRALVDFFEGNPTTVIEFFSHSKDASLGNPFGGFALGWEEIAKRVRLANTYYKDGRSVTFENVSKYVTKDLGYIVDIENCEAKIGGRQEISQVNLRVTSIFRREDTGWKLIHRHADPLVPIQSANSVLRNRD